jgi:uncharacterized membrane protein YoaK (UPF0700 family)
MQDHPRRDQLIAAALAALAGHVDAVGFIGSGGLFLGVMSGNSPRLGVGLAEAGQVAGFAAGPALAFLPWLLLWMAMIGGAVAGALAWPVFGLLNLGIAAMAALVLAMLIDL